MYIIGIAGGTGSGKTTVVKEIVNSLPEGSVVVIPQDSYYKDSSHVPVEERQFINFDHPDAFDWDLLVEQITQLREGKPLNSPHIHTSHAHASPRQYTLNPRRLSLSRVSWHS